MDTTALKVSKGSKNNSDFLADIKFNEEGHHYIRDHWEAFNSRPQEMERKEHELEAEKIADLAKEEFVQLAAAVDERTDSEHESRKVTEVGVQTESLFGGENEQQSSDDCVNEATETSDDAHLTTLDHNEEESRKPATSPAYKSKYIAIEERKKNSIDEVLEKYRNNVSNNRIFVDEEDKTAMFTDETLERTDSNHQDTKQLLQSSLENASENNSGREEAESKKDALEEVKEKYGAKMETADGTVQNRPKDIDDTGTKRDITDEETRELIADKSATDNTSKTAKEMTKAEEEKAKLAERKKKEFKKDMLIMDMGKY